MEKDKLKDFDFPRKTYKKIKKYDRQEMTDFMQHFYINAFEDGKKYASKNILTEEDLEEVLRNTKGVGPKTLQAIMENIRE